nr:39S ribosomal protein L22, mitochondrial-like [Ciona intestinalis]|eukprot:XP_004225664.1 39S ribosomal protein L22, mitochondrial-like [Ciona intestinalis]
MLRNAAVLSSQVLNLTKVIETKVFWPVISRSIHTSFIVKGRKNPGQHKRIKAHSLTHEDKWTTDLETWTENNKMLYSPMDPEKGVRPAEIYYGRANVRYPPKKLYHVAYIVKGLNIDEAITHLGYINNKAARTIADVLREAQEHAVAEHNVEFKSNLHIVDSFAESSGAVKFPIYHARGRMALGKCRFSNYYCLLREGPAPPKRPKLTALEFGIVHLDELRNRKISDGL